MFTKNAKILGFVFFCAIPAAFSEETGSCPNQTPFEAGIYGEFIYNGEASRRYRICMERGRRRVVAFVRFDSDQIDFPNTKTEQVCLDVEGRKIEVVTRIQRKHRGTYTCLSCCEADASGETPS